MPGIREGSLIADEIPGGARDAYRWVRRSRLELAATVTIVTGSTALTWLTITFCLELHLADLRVRGFANVDLRTNRTSAEEMAPPR